jgi:hypothetical protein
MHCWGYVMVLHVLGRDFCLFVPAWCLDFVSRNIWLAGRLARFW